MTMYGNESGEGVKIIEHLCASGEMLPSQLPSGSSWTPEKKLAAAVLSAGLMARDRAWMMSDEVEWPYSFLRLCDLFGLEADWVRQVVLGKNEEVSAYEPPRTRFRHAA